MKITTSKHSENLRTAVRVESGPVQGFRYSRSGAKFRVLGVILLWQRSSSLTEWILTGLMLEGPVQRKNGGDLTRWHVEDLSHYNVSEWPSWVGEIVELHRPYETASSPGRHHELEIDADA